MKMKAMISQPMAGKTVEEIKAVKKAAEEVLEKEGYEIVNTLFFKEWDNSNDLTDLGVIQIPVYFLSKSLEKMSTCNAVYFCKGWEEARGCRMEHEVAKSYGLTIIYEQ